MRTPVVNEKYDSSPHKLLSQKNLRKERLSKLHMSMYTYTPSFLAPPLQGLNAAEGGKKNSTQMKFPPKLQRIAINIHTYHIPIARVCTAMEM